MSYYLSMVTYIYIFYTSIRYTLLTLYTRYAVTIPPHDSIDNNQN